MSEELVAFTKPRLLSIRKHLEAKGATEPVTTVAQFISHIHETSARWQREDWKCREDDETDVLNPSASSGRCGFAVRAMCSMVFSPVSTAIAHGRIC